MKKLLFLFLTIITLLVFTQPVLATAIQDNLKNVGGTAYYDEFGKEPTISNPDIIVGNIIKIVLGFIGIIFTILILLSGYQWMTAGGNSDIIKKSRDRMINAVIGLIITLGVFSITTFVLQKIFSSTGLYNG